MKRIILLFCLTISFLIFSCGKKQEEVKINKVSVPKDSAVTNTTESKDTNTSKPESSGEITKIYSTTEAKDHLNEDAVVKGYVADVVIREKVSYLNFDRKYPKNTFTGVVFDDKFSEVGDLEIYRNKNVELKGKITIYKGKPQITITSKNQIKLLK
jgi:DNA/RNA endonuclease YhcR with UshA esterase domain